ncbi:hypothetical protein B7L88_gp142 [Rhizobium phage RHEph10]|uniref:hypothetical protein n=1 Tax=Rhizobium phage RHEph10 TaxID=1220717 RepID=UPI0002AAEE30|nr:hypothetical protein B7L88_gp142 [Rhizobium phage RHEph10]AGC36146.1 hypothetical protein RHEph10_gp103 [Rhizobium phage RHEph10]
MPHRKRLRDHLNTIPIEDRTGEAIIEAIRTCLTKFPDLIEEILPGKRLVRVRMTPAERTKVAAKAAAVASKIEADKRHALVLPIIDKILKDDPDASLADIKKVLDNSDITPVRSAKWSRATINYIMTKANLRAKDQS